MKKTLTLLVAGAIALTGCAENGAKLTPEKLAKIRAERSFDSGYKSMSRTAKPKYSDIGSNNYTSRF